MAAKSLKDRILENYTVTGTCEFKSNEGNTYTIFERDAESKGSFYVVTKGDMFIAHVTNKDAIFQSINQYEDDRESVYSIEDLKCTA